MKAVDAVALARATASIVLSREVLTAIVAVVVVIIMAAVVVVAVVAVVVIVAVMMMVVMMAVAAGNFLEFVFIQINHINIVLVLLLALRFASEHCGSSFQLCSAKNRFYYVSFGGHPMILSGSVSSLHPAVSIDRLL
jgi:hypothetical protein